MRKFLEKLRILKPLEIKAGCSHMTKMKGKISAFGESTEVTITGKDNIPYCLKCIEKMSIQCAWCGKPIFISDVITLYSPRGDLKIPPHAIVHDKDTRSLVGCGRVGCADTGMDYAGTWVPPGKVKRTPTAFELLMANPDAKCVYGNPRKQMKVVK